MISGAEIMVRCLEAEGVDTLFGYPGAAICPFYDKLYGSAIRHVLVRQEQNAAHAASGYARASGRAGVCVATSGPGALNLITGIATAYMDSILMAGNPCADQPRAARARRAQEADITGACGPITKHSYLVEGCGRSCRAFSARPPHRDDGPPRAGFDRRAGWTCSSRRSRGRSSTPKGLRFSAISRRRRGIPCRSSARLRRSSRRSARLSAAAAASCSPARARR